MQSLIQLLVPSIFFSVFHCITFTTPNCSSLDWYSHLTFGIVLLKTFCYYDHCNNLAYFQHNFFVVPFFHVIIAITCIILGCF
jgi:hypothetical protein